MIGAPRSGTTLLHEALAQHPEVGMSRSKEPSYFTTDDGVVPDVSGPGAEWLLRHSVFRLADYAAQFEAVAGARAVGEVSPRYLGDAGTAARLHAGLPGVRLVAILRDPVERAFASYLGARRDGWEPATSFLEAIADEPRRAAARWPYARRLEAGLYHRNLSRYLALFPRDALRVYLHEDLEQDPRALLRDLFGFLGVDPGFEADLERRPNRSGEVRNPLLRWLWTRSDAARRALRPLLPQGARDAAFSWVTRDVVKPTLAVADRAALQGYFREDTLRLQELLGRDLAAWLN